MHNKLSSKITVSAPANVMLMGEHAVVFGYQAIVCALSQRMTVTLSPRSDTVITIDSSLAQYHSTIAEILQMNNFDSALSFVLSSIKHVLPKHGFDLHIQTDFSHTIGLGSSACVTAACVHALLLYNNGGATLDETFDVGYQVIQSVQGRGSCSDLAASVYGGLVSYSSSPKVINILNKQWHKSHSLPILNLIYCGYKTPTTEVLAIVEEKRALFPEVYDGLYQQMHMVTVQAEQAIQSQHWQHLGMLMNVYHGLMDALGVSDAQLSEIVYQQRSQNNVLGSKISGSGLGDCVVSLLTEKLTTNDVSAHIDTQGIIHHV